MGESTSTGKLTLPLELMNRLLIGKELLLTNATNLTPTSDPLLIARAILASHDASQLIASGITEHMSAERNNKMQGLMDYIAATEKTTQSRFPSRQIFENISKTRVTFTHQGLLTTL